MLSLFHSMRWRLQAWYTGILVLVIAGLSSVLHWEITRSQWDQVDEELVTSARILEGAMRDVPREILDSISSDLSLPSGLHFPPPLDHEGPRGRDSRFTPQQGPPNRDGRRSPGPPNRPNGVLQPGRESFGRLDWNLNSENSELEKNGPDNLAQKYRSTEVWERSIDWPGAISDQLGRDEGPAYYLIWRLDKSLLKQSNVPPNVLATLGHLPQESIAERLTHDRYVWQQRGPWREIYIRGPRGTLICVGRSVISKHIRTSRLTGSLFVTGLSILVLGTLGGLWTINRSIKPIAKMSETARGINVNRLAERMDLEGVDSELAELGAVLNQMLDRLGASIDQQKRFTADASHELRTPLSVILSSSELALSKPRSGDEYRDHFEKCQRAALRMRNLIESLLTLARVDASPNRENFTRVDLQQVIRESVQLLEPIASECSVSIINEVQACYVNGDPNQLGQAFINLLSNAIKYNSVGGSVRIQSGTEDSNVLIEIIDTGVGIPEEDLPHVFERFYRVDQARSRAQGGTGLGLSITERIVSAHNGEIGARSKLGEGSTFWVKLQSCSLGP